jgi:UDP-N-acetylglucosamine 2-epimerase (non-hydrolysing)
MRDVTERPEAVAAGTVQLVGTDVHRIVSAVHRLYDNDVATLSFAHRRNPYGDGYASTRIVAALLGKTVAEFAGDSPASHQQEKIKGEQLPAGLLYGAISSNPAGIATSS